MFTRLSFILLLSALTLGCEAAQLQALKTYMAVEKGIAVDDGTEIIATGEQAIAVRALTDKLDFPWDIAFLPDGGLLVTERPGNLLLLDPQTGATAKVSGVPTVYYRGQGGLLGTVLHPNFAENGWLYLAMAVAVDDEQRTTRVVRYTLQGQTLAEPLLIFEATPAVSSHNHFGGALLFDNDGYLYIAMGDRKERHLAQALDNSLGKILRYRDDGSIPSDNPFVTTPGALPQIFSYGHRNPQGLTIDRATGRMWNAEHGPQGGDEINLLQAGANYGWPVITYGEEYGGGKIGEGTQRNDMQQPLHYYVPSIGTAGLTYYDGAALPGWTGDLFVAGLRSFSVSRVHFSDTKSAVEERLLEGLSLRARNLKQGPDGLLYVVTENGGILQISPATGE